MNSKLLIPLVILLFLPSVVSATDYYVSKNGNNGDGRSWDNAWNELNQISWGSINPGDIIYLDGGSVACAYPTYVTSSSAQPKSPSGGACGMTYETTLSPEKNGASGNPITIQLSTESGRDGTVILFGGRPPLPDCESGSGSNGRFTGIDVGGDSWIVVDGMKWAGIKIHSFQRGISFDSSSSDITIRNVEVYDGGDMSWDAGPCVQLSGTRCTLERAIVHDCGQDNLQGGPGISDFTLRRSWLFNQRKHGSRNDVFNACPHSDGIQVWTGGNQYGLTVEDSIIGPGFMQGFIFGDSSMIHDFTIRNSLVIAYDGGSWNANIMAKSYGTSPANNYLIDHVTSVAVPGASYWNLHIMGGSGHVVRDSIFYGGEFLLVGGLQSASNNVVYQVQEVDSSYSSRSDIGTISADPQFVNPYFPGAGEDYTASFDFTSQSHPDKGTTITSPAALFGGVEECETNEECDDGLYCNGEETCPSGSCVSSGNPCTDDGYSCTTLCVEPGSCNVPDYSVCSTSGTCIDSGICDPGDPEADSAGCVIDYSDSGTSCDDGVDCTDDQCDGSGTCVGIPNNAACSLPQDCTSATCTLAGCVYDPPGCTVMAFLPGEDVEAEDGEITAPMETGSDGTNQYVYHGGTTENLGSVSFTFNIQQPGKYRMEARINSHSDLGQDSFYVGLDDEPAKFDEYAYDTVLSDVFVWDNVSLRGGGTFETADHDPMNWTLSEGLHTFTFYGREVNCWLDQIRLLPAEQTYHRADTNTNCVIDIDELIVFMNRWKVSIADVGMPEMMDAIAKWKAGDSCS